MKDFVAFRAATLRGAVSDRHESYTSNVAAGPPASMRLR
jgi:hypothetical protein